MSSKWRTSPFPDSSHITLASEFVAVLDDWGRVPVLEPDVGIVEINEHWHVGGGTVLYRLVVRGTRLGWVD